MKRTLRTILTSALMMCVAIMMSFALAGCQKDDPDTPGGGAKDNGTELAELLKKKINTIAPDEVISVAKQMGMTINDGTTPPDIVGKYLFDAVTLKKGNVGNSSPGDVFNDFVATFSSQNNNNFSVNLIDTEFETAISGAICGNGSKFTAFFPYVVKSEDGTSLNLCIIYSGTIDSEGLYNAQYGMFFTDKDYVGRGNLYYEVDGLAVRNGELKPQEPSYEGMQFVVFPKGESSPQLITVKKDGECDILPTGAPVSKYATRCGQGGDYFAYISKDEKAIVVNLKTLEWKELPCAHAERSMVVSPDGSKVAFEGSNANESWWILYNIFVYDTKTGNMEEISPLGFINSQPEMNRNDLSLMDRRSLDIKAISNDGKIYADMKGWMSGSMVHEIYSMVATYDLKTQQFTRLSTTEEKSAIIWFVSQDERKLYYQDSGSGWSKGYMLDLATGTRTELAGWDGLRNEAYGWHAVGNSMAFHNSVLCRIDNNGTLNTTNYRSYESVYDCVQFNEDRTRIISCYYGDIYITESLDKETGCERICKVPEAFNIIYVRNSK